MSLSFLSVDAAADRGAFHPVARSAIDRAQRDLGASFEERDGWLVPISIPGEAEHTAVGVADVSHLTKLELRPAGEAIEGDGTKAKRGHHDFRSAPASGPATFAMRSASNDLVSNATATVSPGESIIPWTIPDRSAPRGGRCFAG